MNGQAVKAAVVGALGGLLFGFDTAVIAGTTHQLSTLYSLTPLTLGLTVFTGLLGTVVGALFAGCLGQRFGGRQMLRLMAVFYTVSAVCSALAWNWYALMGARFLAGLGVGGSSVLAPVYIAELSPARWRGRMVGLFQVNVVLGILSAYLSNYFITTLNLGMNQWRCEFGVALVPSLIFLVLLYGIPQSPRWLVTMGCLEEARFVLQRIGSRDTGAELQAIANSVHLERGAAEEPLFQRKYARPIVLAVTIGLFTQLSGINAILYYSNYIFASAGFDAGSAALQTVGIGLVNLVGTIVGMSLIDRLGRKALLLTGSVGMTIALAATSAIFYSRSHQKLLIWSLVLFIVFFAISQGTVIWVYIAEVFPSRVRSKGQSLGASSHWIMNALIAAFFPYFASRSQALPFAFFACMMLLQFFIVLTVYPETKGVSLEKIQQSLRII